MKKKKLVCIMAVLESVLLGELVGCVVLYVAYFLELRTGTEIVTYDIFRF